MQPTELADLHLFAQFNHLVDVAVDVYTSSEYWLHTNYPRGYIVVFLFISLASSGIYVFDIVTDVLVAQVRALWINRCCISTHQLVQQ
jgi:hypothetical protein